MTEQLKPVAKAWRGRFGRGVYTTFFEGQMEKITEDAVILYAIPPTHRVVSVELLERAIDFIQYRDYGRELEDILRAIIDNNYSEK